MEYQQRIVDILLKASIQRVHVFLLIDTILSELNFFIARFETICSVEPFVAVLVLDYGVWSSRGE